MFSRLALQPGGLCASAPWLLTSSSPALTRTPATSTTVLLIIRIRTPPGQVATLVVGWGGVVKPQMAERWSDYHRGLVFPWESRRRCYGGLFIACEFHYRL